MNVRAIVNPRAGSGATRPLTALHRTRPSWPRIEVVLTQGPGDARALASEAAQQGCDLVIAVGGDGTVNEVASGLLGGRTTFAILPLGSGNGLARTLHIPRDAERALSLLESGVRRRMDVGFANDRPFFNVAGVGFDAAVGSEFNRRGRAGGRRGLASYMRLALTKNLFYCCPTLSLEVGEARVEGALFLVSFFNAREYGGGVRLAPRARLDDGRLDVVVVSEPNPWKRLLNMPRVYRGGIERFGGYEHFSAEHACLSSHEPFVFHCDGETGPECTALEVRVERQALEILVPRSVAEDASSALPAPA